MRFEHQQEVFNFSEEVTCGGRFLLNHAGTNKQFAFRYSCAAVNVTNTQSEAAPQDHVGCTDVCCYTSSVHFQVKPAFRDLMSQCVKYPLMRQSSVNEQS